MFNKYYRLGIIFGLLLLGCCVNGVQANFGDKTKSQIGTFINQWVEMWNSYDLNQIDKLFLKSNQLSYFSSEKEGVIKGFKNVVDHHVGFGFIKGGKKSPNRLWLDQVNIFPNQPDTVVTAIWYFKKPDGSCQKGPVTFVCRKTKKGFKFIHLNFGNYKQEATGEKEILKVVQSFFDVIETRDLELAKKIMIPGGNTFSIRGKGKNKVLRLQTYEQFMKSISKAGKQYKEVMHNPRVLIHGDIAMVWTDYTFYIDGKKSHTGVDAFSLIKVKNQWQIAGAIYTVEKE